MTGFNLSEWAIRHRALVAYFMLMIVVAGVASYFRLGRSEDPDFTVKTMVVAAIWPGATVEDTIQQVTDRLERKLRNAKQTTPRATPAPAGRRGLVYVDSTSPGDAPDTGYQVRKKVRDISHCHRV
jgi:multidrug efflux pump subunit AcrB